MPEDASQHTDHDVAMPRRTDRTFAATITTTDRSGQQLTDQPNNKCNDLPAPAPCARARAALAGRRQAPARRPDFEREEASSLTPTITKINEHRPTSRPLQDNIRRQVAMLPCKNGACDVPFARQCQKITSCKKNNWPMLIYLTISPPRSTIHHYRQGAFVNDRQRPTAYHRHARCRRRARLSHHHHRIDQSLYGAKDDQRSPYVRSPSGSMLQQKIDQANVGHA